MKLITLDNLYIVTQANGLQYVDFTITIPNDARIAYFYVSGNDISTESDIENYEFFKDNTDKNYFKNTFDLVTTNNNGTCTYRLADGIELSALKGGTGDAQIISDHIFYDAKDGPLYIKLKLDADTEAKYKASCTECSLTFAVYDKIEIMSDIIKYSRYLTDECVSCCKPSEVFIQKILEYRMLEAAVATEDWVFVNNLYKKIYSNEEGGSLLSYTLASKNINKCNCNG